MCGCCNTQDLNMQAASEALDTYKSRAGNEMVPRAEVYEHFIKIYSSGEMAALALGRIERDMGRSGGLWLPAGSVASELELILSCGHIAKEILDG